MEPNFTYWLTPGCVAYRMLTDFICWEKQGPAEASKASGLSFTADERVSRSIYKSFAFSPSLTHRWALVFLANLWLIVIIVVM